jgi:hypothetical protein
MNGMGARCGYWLKLAVIGISLCLFPTPVFTHRSKGNGTQDTANSHHARVIRSLSAESKAHAMFELRKHISCGHPVCH